MKKYLRILALFREKKGTVESEYERLVLLALYRREMVKRDKHLLFGEYGDALYDINMELYDLRQKDKKRYEEIKDWFFENIE